MRCRTCETLQTALSQAIKVPVHRCRVEVEVVSGHLALPRRVLMSERGAPAKGKAKRLAGLMVVYHIAGIG